MDYFISDTVALPPNGAEAFVEKIALVPFSYSVNSHRQAPALRPPRSVLAKFRLTNLDRKVDPSIFETWANAMRRIRRGQPTATLWLMQTTNTARAYLQSEAASRGLSRDELEIVGRASHAEHVRRVASADLYLDTPRCNSVATAADLLWAGVPVMATPLDNLPSRGSTSLLHAIGFLEGIALTQKAYEDLVATVTNT